jgi:hypothetical protein
VGRLTHAYASDGFGFAHSACARCLPRCSSGGRWPRAGREGRSPSSPPPSATRRRCRARGQPQRSCRWLACSLPCHHAKGCRLIGVPEKKRKTIPVLTPVMQRAPDRVIREDFFESGCAHLLAVSGSSTPGLVALVACRVRNSVRVLRGRWHSPRRILMRHPYP